MTITEAGRGIARPFRGRGLKLATCVLVTVAVLCALRMFARHRQAAQLRLNGFDVAGTTRVPFWIETVCGPTVCRHMWKSGIQGECMVWLDGPLVGPTAKKMNSQRLRVLVGFDCCSSLYLPESGLTDADLAEISRMSSIRSLNIADNEVSDSGLHYLTLLPHLESVYLRGTNVTMEGVAALPQGLPSLRDHR